MANLICNEPGIHEKIIVQRISRMDFKWAAPGGQSLMEQSR